MSEQEQIIRSEELLAGHLEAGTCYCCRQDRGWTDQLGNRKCDVCHPQPKPRSQ